MPSIPQRIAVDTDREESLWLTPLDRKTVARFQAEIQASYDEPITITMVIQRLLSDALIAKAVEYHIRDQQGEGVSG